MDNPDVYEKSMPASLDRQITLVDSEAVRWRRAAAGLSLDKLDEELSDWRASV
jgi:hypothetical protein